MTRALGLLRTFLGLALLGLEAVERWDRERQLSRCADQASRRVTTVYEVTPDEAVRQGMRERTLLGGGHAGRATA